MIGKTILQRGASALSIQAITLLWTLFAAHSAFAQGAETQLIPVTVELGDVSLTKLPIILAADNGIFERNGLKVDMFVTPGAAAAVRAAGVIVPPQNIRSNAVGDIQIGGGSPNVVGMTTTTTTPRRVILATMDGTCRYHIITRHDITSPQQLKGKRIGSGSPGVLSQYCMLTYLHKLGWSPAHDVEMYITRGDGIENLQAGLVDAIDGTEIATEAAKKAGLTDLIDLTQFHFVMPGSGVMALADWLPQNHEAATRFIKATVEGIALMKTDKQAAFTSMTKWFGITDPAKLEAIYASAQQLPSKPYPSIEGLKMMHTIYDWRALNNSKPQDFEDSSYVTTRTRAATSTAFIKPKHRTNLYLHFPLDRRGHEWG